MADPYYKRKNAGPTIAELRKTDTRPKSAPAKKERKYVLRVIMTTYKTRERVKTFTTKDAREEWLRRFLRECEARKRASKQERSRWMWRTEYQWDKDVTLAGLDDGPHIEKFDE